MGLVPIMVMKAYLKAQAKLYKLFCEKGFYPDGEVLDYTDWYWTTRVNEAGDAIYYLGYNEVNDGKEDFQYSVDYVLSYLDYSPYTAIAVDNNGEKYVMVFHNDNFVEEIE